MTLLCMDILFCISSRLVSLLNHISIKKAGYVFLHIGVALVILTGFWSMKAEKTYVKVAENQTIDLNSKGYPILLNVQNAKAIYYPTGEPKQYVADINVIRDGKVVCSKNVSVNHPVKYGGIKIYQSTYEIKPGGNVVGLTVKYDPSFPFVLVGFLLIFCGSVFTLVHN